MNPIIFYQVVAVLLLCLGLYALVVRRTLVGMNVNALIFMA